MVELRHLKFQALQWNTALLALQVKLANSSPTADQIPCWTRQRFRRSPCLGPVRPVSRSDGRPEFLNMLERLLAIQASVLIQNGLKGELTRLVNTSGVSVQARDAISPGRGTARLRQASTSRATGTHQPTLMRDRAAIDRALGGDV